MNEEAWPIFALSLIANIAAVVTLPLAVGQVSEFFRTWTLVRRLIPLSRSGDIDVIVTTSDWRVNPRGVGRGLAGFGALRGIDLCARFLVANFPRRNMKICLSKTARIPTTADVILIGGPAKNAKTAEFMELLSANFPSMGPIKTDRDDRHIELSGVCYPASAARHHQSLEAQSDPHSLLEFQRREIPLETFLNPETEEPIYDFGVVISAPNLFVGSGRAIVLYGFSSNGTARTAEWFFETIWITGKAADFRRRLNTRRAEGFIALIELRRDSEDRDASIVQFKELYRSEALS